MMKKGSNITISFVVKIIEIKTYKKILSNINMTALKCTCYTDINQTVFHQNAYTCRYELNKT